MIRRLLSIRTQCTDPFRNLALEEELLRRGAADACVLYLWQNRRTVVIGRNQNARAECRADLLEADGGFLARRLSGGGAVYHDLGNCNFTFLLPSEDYDEARQTGVILGALRMLGLEAERSGRNDLLLDGRKFSGHAYYHAGGRSYHHGTLMVRVDREPLERYLAVSPLKTRARGVESVRSRVCNLTEYRPDLTVPMLTDALENAFAAEYGLPVGRLREEDLDAASIERRRAFFADPAWRYGRAADLPLRREARFPWGTVRVDWAEENGALADVEIATDAMDPYLFRGAAERLRGCPLRRGELAARLGDAGPARDLVRMLLDGAGESGPGTQSP